MSPVEFTPEEIDARFLKAIAQRIDYRARNPLAFYVPYPPVGESKQWQFHLSTAATRLLIGANQIGKTTAGMCESFWHATGQYPEWYPEAGKIKPQRSDEVIRGRIFITDFTRVLKDVFLPELERWEPTQYVRKKPSKSTRGDAVQYFYWHVDQKTGERRKSEFSIMSREQQRQQAEGWKGHWLWIDEPTDRELWVGSARGLMRHKGRDWFTLTLVDDNINDSWIYDELYLPGITGENPRIEVIEAQIWDNPYLSKEAIDDFKSKLRPEEIAARLEGKVKTLQGLIYKEITDARYWIDPFDFCSKDPYTNTAFSFYHGADIHARVPSHFSWVAVDPQGRYFVYDELTLEDKTIAQMAAIILKREREKGLPMTRRYLDPNAGATRSMTSGKTPFQEFQEHGVRFVSGVDNIEMGHNCVLDLLRTGRLFFFNTLSGHRHQLQRYVWDTPSPQSGRSRATYSKPKPREANKHYPDVLRYVLTAYPKYVPPAVPEPVGWRRALDQQAVETPVQSCGREWLLV